MTRWAVALCPLLLAGLAAAEGLRPVQQWAQEANTELPRAALLEVGLLPLDAGISPDMTDSDAALRRAEARYYPYLLRTLLEDSGQWGPVRMLPGPSPTAELLIGGVLIQSTPARLMIRWTVHDATGRVWLDSTYTATAGIDDYRTGGDDPFLETFRQLAADLAQFRTKLTLDELSEIIRVARLRYARKLASGIFESYLVKDPDGHWRVNRLPAEGDPMMARVERVRESEYLFVDTVDQHYGSYFREIGPTYLALRKAILEADLLMQAYRRQANDGRESLQQRYNQLRELKLYQQTLRETLGSFAFEVGPTTVDLEGEVITLSGTLTDQYAKWQDLLDRIHAAEVGL